MKSRRQVSACPVRVVSGFTLVELLTVVAIIGILTAISVPAVFAAQGVGPSFYLSKQPAATRNRTQQLCLAQKRVLQRGIQLELRRRSHGRRLGGGFGGSGDAGRADALSFE